MKICPSV